jgi:hypothetical protein
MATIQNQTPPDSFKNFSPGHKGSGVFAIPDPHRDELGAFKKDIVLGITYGSCTRRGAFCIAFKWVPHALNDTQCPTPGEPCKGFCADDRCLCIEGKCL